MDWTRVGIEDLQGRVITSISGMEGGSEEVIIKTLCGYKYKLYHSQDCCECVFLHEVTGVDPKDLIGAQITSAEETSNDAGILEESDESYTWTFYRLNTPQGSIQMRWYGSSNGYYSEEITVKRLREKKVSDEGEDYDG